ncbi:MAG: M23 family metallopeptidase [Chitinophagales bacterium]|nr:M23 family metallopeptidase [Chitinophagales bacterium]
MKKEKYYYNLKTLQYEKVKVSLVSRILRALGFLSAALVSAFILSIIGGSLFSSPKEKMLMQENAAQKEQIEYLGSAVDELSEVVENLQERDRNIYRVIFESEPIAYSLWNSGVGGSERYKELAKFNTGELMIDVNSKLDGLKRKMYWQSQSYDEIAKLVSNKEEKLQSLPAIQPVSNTDLKRMASGYGWRIDPVYGVSKFHAGMDFTAPVGTEVYATGKGKAVKVDYSTGGYGNRIIIDHGYGYQTLYAHLSSFEIKAGDEVHRGQVIGYVGNTGKSVGPHLHYEVHKNGEKLNPVYFYYQDLDDISYEEMIRMSENTGSSLD